jgi:hypothetical protein
MKVAETGGSGTSSSSLSPYAGGESHRHLQKPRNATSSCFYFVFFSSSPICSFFSFLGLLFLLLLQIDFAPPSSSDLLHGGLVR